MAKKFEVLRSRLPLETRARAATSANEMLVEMDSASLVDNVPKRRRDTRSLAATSASVSYKETLKPDELALILFSGEVPPRFLPHLRVVLEQLPPSVLDGIGEAGDVT